MTSAATRASSEIIVRKMDSGEAARKTAESRQRLEDLFSRLDLNKDGVIDPKELQAGLRVMGYRHVTQEQIDVRACLHVSTKIDERDFTINSLHLPL